MTATTGIVRGVRVSHDRATVDDLDATGVDSQRGAVDALVGRPGIDEAFVLSTCNRVEGYVVTDDDEAGDAALESVTGDVDPSVPVAMDHEESLRHLLRVAAGLESLVLGEDQILGQVRDAAADARAVGGLGPVLDDALTKAIRVGERARTETRINEGVLSLGSAAVRLAQRQGALPAETGLVIGAGEIATLGARALATEVDELVVANRTVSHAAHVADAVDCEADAVGLDELSREIAAASVVLSATSAPDRLLDADAFGESGETYLLDLAQPRDAPPAAETPPSVTVRDLDDLEAVTAETRDQRETAAAAVEAIVEEEFDRLMSQYKRQRADRVIAAMYESADRIKAQELRTARTKLNLDEDEEAVVEAMADAIVSQLLAAPTSSLRDAAEEDDWATIHTALELFDPEFGPGGDTPPAFVADIHPDELPEGMREELPAAVLEQLE